MSKHQVSRPSGLRREPKRRRDRRRWYTIERLESRCVLAATVSGQVFDDLNGDQIWQSESPNFEPALDCWTVYLDLDRNGSLDVGEPTTLTAADGSYQLQVVLPGEYAVGLLTEPGYERTTPVNFGLSTTLVSGGASDHVFAPTKDILYTTAGDRILRNYTSENAEILTSLGVGTSLTAIDVTPDGKFLLVGEGATTAEEGRLYKIELATSAVTTLPYSLEPGEGGVFDLAIVSNTRALFTTSSSTNGTVPLREIDLATNEITVRTEDFGIGEGTIQSHSRLERNASRTHLLLAEAHDANGSVHLYKAATDSFIANGQVNASLDDAHLAVSRDGTRIAIESADLGLKVFDDQFGTVAPLAHFKGGVAFDSLRNILYVGDKDTDELVAIDSNSLDELYRVAAGEDLATATNYFEMQVDGRANNLSVTTPSGVRFIELNRAVPYVVTLVNNQAVENLDFGNWVNGENRRPIAISNTYNAVEDTQLTVSAPGVLGNDFDPEGVTLTPQIIANPEFGNLNLLANGSFQYTPFANYFGTDKFSYRVSDGQYSSCRAATVTVNVSSVNDAPTEIIVSETSVEENSPGATIGTVEVVDADQADQFGFVLSDGRFEIVNGILQLKNGVSLNHEQAPTINLTITAHDSGTPQESITKTILIQVGDVNEFDPMVQTTTINVEEGKTTVGEVEVSDEDSTQTIEITIVEGNDDGIFSVNSDGIIFVNDGFELDHEGTEIYVLTISVTDDVEPKRTTTTDITITVTDGNENDPVVTPATFEIAENSPDGTIVGTVTATDADAGQTLTYTIAGGNESGAFSIDPVSGEITVTDSLQLDAEQVSQFTLLVRATDNGSPNRSGEAEVIIKLTNVNEFTPVIANQSVTIAESVPVDTVILIASATDADVTSTITYSLTGGPFAIDSQTGAIRVTSGLDVESVQQYLLTVTATDTVSPALSGTATITVHISDVNEFDPSMADETFTIPEDAAHGFLVGNVSATDQDFTHTLRFSLAGGNESGMFAIDPVTGKISYVSGNLPSHNSNTEFELTALVSDGLNPARTDEAKVTVKIGAANVAPTANDATFTLPENSSNGTVVGTVTATDPESGSILTYQITSPNESFAIESSTGKITVTDSTKLNIESVTHFTLNVRVTDNGTIAKSDVATITIQLSDVNEFAPVMSDATLTIDEGVVLGTLLGAVHASDLDITQEMNYSMPEGAFRIHPSSGVITVADASQLNYEAASTVILTVTATDSGTPAKSVTATVTVNLRDRNEAAPVTANKSFSVTESAAVGTTLGTITATDADTQQSIQFQFIGGNVGNAFDINQNTGEITVRNPGAIDAETIPEFLLLVRVFDSGIPMLSATSTVTVNVQGINEAPVAIALDNLTVGEHMKGATIGLVSVTDFDVGDPHTFSVNDSRFTINSNRHLKLKDGEELDLDNGNQVPIEITATDSGGLSVSQNFVVLVALNAKQWQNSVAPLDVNGDGQITPGDVLQVINEINTPKMTDAQGKLPLNRPDSPNVPYYDVNGDGVVSPIDALIIINALNRDPSNQAEGEAGFSTADSTASVAVVDSPARTADNSPEQQSWAVSPFDDEDSDDLESLLDDLADDLAGVWDDLA